MNITILSPLPPRLQLQYYPNAMTMNTTHVTNLNKNTKDITFNSIGIITGTDNKSDVKF